MLLALLGLLMGWGMVGMAHAVTFNTTDNPGSYFDCSGTPGCITYGGQKSLAIITPGQTVTFKSTGDAKTLHTAVSLIWPTGAAGMPFDKDLDPLTPSLPAGSSYDVTLTTPGLHVFYCDIHPYMFAAVIVDNPLTTQGYDLGASVDVVVAGNTIPTSSDLATRLVRTFFIATDPTNWKDYSVAGSWHITYPSVPVLTDITSGGVAVPLNLETVLNTRYGNDTPKALLFKPGTPAVGDVWVDTQFELKGLGVKAGTATAVEGQTWTTTRKVGLSMNNPHNMWTSNDQSVIYQTEWFGNELTVFDRKLGTQIGSKLIVGPAPAHVMTRSNNGDVHVSLNGANDVVELKPAIGNPGSLTNIRNIPMSLTPDESTHPHAHWMSANGNMMVTPNPDTEDSTLYDFKSDQITSRTAVGHFPIATGMMPDSSKYYVANFLDSTISVIKINKHHGLPPSASHIKDINLLANYNPISGLITGPVGALPIQTPVSPDGKVMITANTLTGTLTIVDTRTDEVVAMLPCEPGCHGVTYGAKKDKRGGYYAYVSSKFTNVLLVIDLDPNHNGNIAQASIVGRILLANDAAPHDQDISGNRGMGGQGVLSIPVVYNGWVQQLPYEWKRQLTENQKNPIDDKQ
jgi:DNA-binding beta-propeller fold protein YncE